MDCRTGEVGLVWGTDVRSEALQIRRARWVRAPGCRCCTAACAQMALRRATDHREANRGRGDRTRISGQRLAALTPAAPRRWGPRGSRDTATGRVLVCEAWRQSPRSPTRDWRRDRVRVEVPLEGRQSRRRDLLAPPWLAVAVARRASTDGVAQPAKAHHDQENHAQGVMHVADVCWQPGWLHARSSGAAGRGNTPSWGNCGP